ncbi:MAG TPA: VOC family protein [Blastocatellia bacterium]|nr:VOC family protein [Blastocatellia bacterium]
MPRVVHFEIAASEPERASEFYRKVFGWEIKKWDGPQPYWLVSTGNKEQPGIDGGILKGNNGTVNSIDVDSVDDYISKVTASGGKVAMPKMEIQGVGFIAYCQDTEGNTFGLFQPTHKH